MKLSHWITGIISFSSLLLAQPHPTHPIIKQSLLRRHLIKKFYNPQVFSWDSISLAGHYFTGCQGACLDAKPALNLWLKGRMQFDDYQQVHRGYVLKILAEKKMPWQATITFKNQKTVTVQNLLHYEFQRASSLTPINRREKKYGLEWGWLLYAGCYYYDHLSNLSIKKTVIHNLQRIAKYITDNGINRNIESGLHEMEGLLYCLDKPAFKAISERKRLQENVRLLVEQDLASWTKTNYLPYGRDQSWSICDDPSCYAVQNLNQWAHFSDIVTAYQGDHPALQAIQKNVRQGVKRVLKTVDREWVEHHFYHRYLLAGAVGHTLAVLK